MDIKALETAMEEAKRFLVKAEEAQKRWVSDWSKLGIIKRDYFTNISAENAACKRASMDLTRALSRLRNP